MKAPPLPFPVTRLEPSDEGLYVHIGPPRTIASTFVLRSWPLVAIDLDSSGIPVGMEARPAPRGDLGRWVARQAEAIGKKV